LPGSVSEKPAYRSQLGRKPPSARPGKAISSHFKHALAGENLKFFFAPYATEHDEVNAVGTWISKKLFKWASVLNNGKHASLKVGRDSINHLRQFVGGQIS